MPAHPWLIEFPLPDSLDPGIAGAVGDRVLSNPETAISCVESAVMTFSNPDTVTAVQWPVISTVLFAPLMITMLSLHVTDLLVPITADRHGGARFGVESKGPRRCRSGW